VGRLFAFERLQTEKLMSWRPQTATVTLQADIFGHALQLMVDLQRNAICKCFRAYAADGFSFHSEDGPFERDLLNQNT
jgi:hypothetical protein